MPSTIESKLDLKLLEKGRGVSERILNGEAWWGGENNGSLSICKCPSIRNGIKGETWFQKQRSWWAKNSQKDLKLKEKVKSRKKQTHLALQ